MLLMAGVARGRLRNDPSCLHAVKRIKAPSAGQGRVLHMDLQPHQLAGLGQAVLVQRSLLLPAMHRATVLQNQGRSVRPSPGLHELPIARGVHEDRIEHRVVRCLFLGVVAHIHAGAQINPLPILRRELKLFICRDHRPVRSCNRSDSLRRKNAKQHRRCHSKREQRSNQHRSTFFVVE